jgi:hypothetical protein
VISLDAATVLLQWAVGGLTFGWVTTRHREVGLGYGWLIRGTFVLVALSAFAAGLLQDPVPVREAASVGVALAALAALGSSVLRRKAGVRHHHADQERRSARVAAMTGIERTTPMGGTATDDASGTPEFDPRWDLVAPAIGLVGLVAAGLEADSQPALAVVRVLVGALFLGAVTDAMLLGHWYLVQPGLARRHLLELVRLLTWLWPVEVLVMLIPTGMVSVLNGSIDDGWGGTLGWMWVACAATTLGLCITTRAALKERAYSAVMAATGLLYLAILTAFGMDLVARAVLA